MNKETIKYYYLIKDWQHDKYFNKEYKNRLTKYDEILSEPSMRLFDSMEKLNANFKNWCFHNNAETAYIGEIEVKPGKKVKLVTQYVEYKEDKQNE